MQGQVQVRAQAQEQGVQEMVQVLLVAVVALALEMVLLWALLLEKQKVRELARENFLLEELLDESQLNSRILSGKVREMAFELERALPPQ